MEDLPKFTPGAGFNLLQDIRVVDLTTSIAGPYATMLLADMGAEVIKIERPGAGDDTRAWGPPFLEGESLWFAAVNRGKKSVVLDLKTDQGKAHIAKLVASADVVVTNQPPRVQKKLGLDYETLKQHRADLIFTSITGFGLTGERADLACYDLIAEGYSGIMDLTGAADSEPQKVGAPAADMLAGQDAAMATIAALFDRLRTGNGHLVDVALLDSMTRFLSARVSSYLGSGEVPTRTGGTDSVIAIYQAFETKDRPITLGLGTDGIWQRFWDAMGNPDYAGQSGFESNAARREKRAQIVADIQTHLRTKSRADWLAIFAKARVPAGPINAVDELAADKALQDRGMFYMLDDSTRMMPQIGLGIQIDGGYSVAQSMPPLHGEHTESVLGTLDGKQTNGRGNTK